jgi:hypothetical protein
MNVKLVGEREPSNFPRRFFFFRFSSRQNFELWVSIQTVLHTVKFDPFVPKIVSPFRSLLLNQHFNFIATGFSLDGALFVHDPLSDS